MQEDHRGTKKTYMQAISHTAKYLTRQPMPTLGCVPILKECTTTGMNAPSLHMVWGSNKWPGTQLLLLQLA